MSPHTIRKGSAEFSERAANPDAPIPARIRRPGGGRKSCTESDPELVAALELLVDPATRGDPMSPLRWTSKSTSQLAKELTRGGHPVNPSTVGRLLRAAGYSLQSNRKTSEGGGHPDRNAQFEHINAAVRAFQESVASLSSRSTRRRRNWLGSSGTAGGSGSRAASPRRCSSTTSWTRSSARRSLTASTTSQATKAGSAWVSTTIRPGSRRRRSAAGGGRWGRSATAGRTDC